VKRHIAFKDNSPIVAIGYHQILAPNNDRGTDKLNSDLALLEL